MMTAKQIHESAHAWFRSLGLKALIGHWKLLNSSLILTIHINSGLTDYFVSEVFSQAVSFKNTQSIWPNLQFCCFSPLSMCFFLLRKFVPGGRSYMTNQEWCELGAQDGFNS